MTDLIFTHALTESREEKSRDPENEKSVQQPCFKARKLEGQEEGIRRKKREKERGRSLQK